MLYCILNYVYVGLHGLEIDAIYGLHIADTAHPLCVAISVQNII